MQDTCVIVPMYNEEKAIAATIEKLSAKFEWIICVNDGSADSTESIAEKKGVIIINHSVKLGQGAAIQTGIDYATKNKSFKYFVTFDADGQHRVPDAVRLVKHIKKHPVDIVLGSRFLSEKSNISTSKKVLLKMAVYYSNLTSGTKLTDAHNGLRVFNRHVAETINLELAGMAHASEFIHKIAVNNYSYMELPVVIKYTGYSRNKGQPMINSLNILFELAENRMSKK